MSNPCKWNGTRPIGLEKIKDAGVNRKKADRLKEKLVNDKREVKRYVVTSAQNATPVHKEFVASLKGYCALNKAQLIVIPYRYKNPTSIWTADNDDDDWWAPELAPYLLDHRIDLNNNLVLLADIKTQPTATSPLQGYETMAGWRSAIIGHPKLELTTVATPQKKLPKIFTTTGACTQANYIQGKAGKKGEFHHTYGACVVEVVSDDEFHLRQINATPDGSFHDLEWRHAGGKRKVMPIAAIVLGDEHEEFIDETAASATYGDKGMIDVLKPKYVVHHDVHDFFSRNHHHKHECFTNFAKHHAGLDNVERALDKTFDFIDRNTRPGTHNVFVASNHPDALSRWVKEADPKTDPENAIFWAQTFKVMCENAHINKGGASTIDPFRYWGERKLKTIKQATFLHRDQSFVVNGIELGYHGDKGPNGARGSRNAYSKIGVKTVIGHSHSPGIKDGCYQVGTLAHLSLEYASGPSSWLQTNCVVYANGKRSLVSIIGGKWRAPK